MQRPTRKNRSRNYLKFELKYLAEVAKVYSTEEDLSKQKKKMEGTDRDWTDIATYKTNRLRVYVGIIKVLLRFSSTRSFSMSGSMTLRGCVTGHLTCANL